MKMITRIKAIIMSVLILLSACSLPFTVMAAESGDGEFYLTWEEYTAGHGLDKWNWNDAADAIEEVALHAADLYDAGEKEKAYEYAKATYWGYYETTGFERNVMTYVSGSRVSAVELQFTTLRKAVKKDLGSETVREEAKKLSDMLHEDALVLSPEGAIGDAAGEEEMSTDATGTDGTPAAEDTGAAPAAAATTAGALATFFGSFGIILREGLEAILIVGAIIAYLIKSGNKQGVVPVYIGSVFAIVCSFVMAGILAYLKAINPETAMSQEIIEGIAALLAVAVLFYVSNWMISKSESEAWSAYIEGKVAEGAGKGSMFVLGFTAWLAVFREGAEVILFYQPMLKEQYKNMVWAGFLTGCVALVAVFLLIRFLSIKLPIKPFFMGTSILMAIMTVCFLGAGIKELMEGGVFDGAEFMLSSPAWLSWIPYNDVLDVFGIYPLVGTIVPQLIMTVIIVTTFMMAIRKNERIKEGAKK